MPWILSEECKELEEVHFQTTESLRNLLSMQCEEGLWKYECGNIKDMGLESTESGRPLMTGFIWD